MPRTTSGHTRRTQLFALAAALAGTLATAGSLAATDRTVTSCADSGPGSLRETLATANAGDTIQVPPCSIALMSGPLRIDRSVTIRGSGQLATELSGGEGEFSGIDPYAIEIAGTATDAVTVADLTVDGGISATQSPLRLTNVTIRGRNRGGLGSGGGIRSTGSLILVGSTVEGGTAGSGGGISSGGSLVLVNSTVRNNNAAGGIGSCRCGGGIASSGSLSLVNSTISGNSADQFAGGIRASSATTIVNSTVSGNRGDGIDSANLALSSSLTVVNSTIAANIGRGIHSNGTTLLRSTIVALNTVADCDGLGGVLTSAGHNLDMDGTCNLTGPGDLARTDPRLGPLFDNGGPTQTHALLPGSPGIDAGDPADCPTTDQRGAPRPPAAAAGAGARCDIGAIEAGAVVPPGPAPGALPALSLQVNGSVFRAGETISVSATLMPGDDAVSPIDAYVVVKLPDGSLRSLTLGGRLLPGLVPIAIRFRPIAFAGELLRYTFTGTEPPGMYTWFAGVTVPSTLGVIGAIDQHAFTFAP